MKPIKNPKNRASDVLDGKKVHREWKEGATTTELAKKHHCNPVLIKEMLVEIVGEEEYYKVSRSRTGAGSVKRKTKPTYPKWMLKGL